MQKRSVGCHAPFVIFQDISSELPEILLLILRFSEYMEERLRNYPARWYTFRKYTLNDDRRINGQKTVAWSACGPVRDR